MTAATSQPQGGPSNSTIVRWLWTWITLGILVVVVVIGFLLGIVRALGSINGGLVEAATSVSAIGKDADPLPGAIQSINNNLTGIDTSLKPIPGQAGQIGTGLNQIRDSLKMVDASLKNTAGSLVSTNGSLVDTTKILVGVAGSTSNISSSLSDTTNILKTVLNSAGKINDTLRAAQRRDSEGTELIPINVDRVNRVLDPVQDDTHTVVGQLRGVNQNLTAICQSPLLLALPPFTCGR
jgi:methyl-accepting chemotaxis protein